MRHEYRLTAKGRDLSPALVALMRWGDRWAADGEPPTLLVHDACGTELEQLLRCPRLRRRGHPHPHPEHATRAMSDRHAGHLQPEGLHPADDAVPRPVRLLHLRQGTGPARRARTSPPTRCSPSPPPARQVGCHEALFTLGEAPEERYPVARDWLAEHGYASTVDYLVAMCRLVLDETGLLPHANAGALDAADLARPARRLAEPGDDGRDAAGRPRRPPRRAGQDARAPPRHPRGRRRARRSRSPPASSSASARTAPTASRRSRPSPPATAATATCRR